MTNTIRIVDLVSDNNDRKYEPAGRMAEAIIEITQEQGDCLPQDLNARGFTPREVSDYWHLAKSIAAVELHMRGQKSLKLFPSSRKKP